MGILNNNLGINLTNREPLTSNPFSAQSDNFAMSPPVQSVLELLSAPSDDFLLLNDDELALL